LPSELREKLELSPGDALDLTVRDGSIVLTPVAVVPRPASLLALSDRGKRKERTADAEIKAGKTRTFDTAEELIDELNEDR